MGAVAWCADHTLKINQSSRFVAFFEFFTLCLFSLMDFCGKRICVVLNSFDVFIRGGQGSQMRWSVGII